MLRIEKLITELDNEFILKRLRFIERRHQEFLKSQDGKKYGCVKALLLPNTTLNKKEFFETYSLTPKGWNVVIREGNVIVSVVPSRMLLCDTDDVRVQIKLLYFIANGKITQDEVEEYVATVGEKIRELSKLLNQNVLGRTVGIETLISYGYEQKEQVKKNKDKRDLI